MKFKFECPNCSNFIIIDNPNFKDNFKDINLNSGDDFYSNLK